MTNLREVHWEITNRCNLACNHCLPMSGRARPDELLTDESISALRTFNAAGASRLALTGGEPFVRSDIMEILQVAGEFGYCSSIITNGTELTTDRLIELTRLNVALALSLDGATATTNDAVRGRGSFKQIITALSRCCEAGISPWLYVTVTADNLVELPAIFELAVRSGCAGIHLNELTLGGRALKRSHLALMQADRQQLVEQTRRETLRVFGEQLSPPNNDCWVDGSTLYMDAAGNLFVCSEVANRQRQLSIGNIRSFDLDQWYRSTGECIGQHCDRCCYGLLASPHVVLQYNVSDECAFAPQQQIITFEDLQVACQALYQGIESACQECTDPDCMGYIWVLPSERQSLYEAGVSLVRINDSITLLNSFETRSDGTLDLIVKYPKCILHCHTTGRCTIHDIRPAVCHLYPLGLETTADGLVVWGLHRDCLFVRLLAERKQLSEFCRRAIAVIDRIGQNLRSEILATYTQVDMLVTFPDGENNYLIVKEVTNVQVRGGSRQPEDQDDRC